MKTPESQPYAALVDCRPIRAPHTIRMQSPKPRTTRIRGVVPVALLASSLLANVLPAQTAPAPAANTTADQSSDSDIVRLSEFDVSTARDYGYRATNSIAGTRTDTPIRDVPLNIQVFTKDLSDDLHFVNTVQLEAYSASVVNGGSDARSDNIIQQQYQSFVFRGFLQNWSLRDGIREYDPVDTQDIARVEYVKGPAAALYGLAYPGGVQNNITKSADLSKSFTELRVSSGSYGETRGTIDTNVASSINGHKFALRFNGVDEETRDNRAHSKGYISMEAVSATFMLTPTTKVDGLYEQGDKKKPNGLGYFTTDEGPEYRNADGSNKNQAAIPLQILHPEIPWTWNWSNGQDFRTLSTALYRAKITQSIGDNFTVQAYAQYSNRLQIDGQGWDANGSGGADSWESPNSGWIQSPSGDTIQETYHYRDWQNNMHAYGATGVYKLETGPVKNTFAFGYNMWSERELSVDKADPNQNPLIFPLEANIPINIPFGPPPGLVPVISNNQFGPGNPGGNAYNHENNSNNYYYINWQTSSLDNRLKTNIGLNHTSIKLEHWDDGVSASPSNVYNASKWSPLFGATFDVVKDVSVFAVHSTSLFPDTTKDSYGRQFSPQVGSSIEAGVKVDLWDQKVTGTVSVYRIRQSGGSQNDPTHSNFQTDKFDNDSPAQRLIDFPTGQRPALGDNVAGGTQESKGIEEDLIFQPTHQWQILTSFAHNNEEVTASKTPSTIGQSVPFHTNNLYAILTKYTFSDGPAKGLYVGGGAHGGSQQLQGYVTDPATGKLVGRYYDTPWRVQAFAGYHYKIWGYNTLLQLNLDNITGAPEYVGWKATSNPNKLATVGYKVPNPTTFTVTLGVDF